MTTLILLILATFGLTEWLRHDHRVAELFARFEHRLPGWVMEAYQCGFCLSHWSAILILLLWFALPWGWPFVYLFALVRGANLLSDITKQWNKSPNRLWSPEPPKLPTPKNPDSTN